MKYAKGKNPNSHRNNHWRYQTITESPQGYQRALESGFVPGVRKPPANLKDDIHTP